MRKQELLLIQIFVASMVIIGGAYFLRANTVPPEIPLFYSLTEGNDIIVPTYYIFLLPLLSLVIVIVNIFLYHRIFNHDLFVRKLLYYACVTAIVITTLIFLKIIFLIS